MYDFLEIELHNDPVKLTVQRSSMQILAFFGAIGGMQRFVGAILGKVGGYFSGKFFGAKLMTDLYIQKKNSGKNKPKAPIVTPSKLDETPLKEGGTADEHGNGARKFVKPPIMDMQDINQKIVRQQNRLSIGPDFNKGQHYQRFKIKTWHLYLDRHLAKFSSCFKCSKASSSRLKLLSISGKRVAQELNVIKLLQKIRLSMELARIQLSRKDILSLQKGKHSVIDLDTSEPGDIESVETDTTTDDEGLMEHVADGLEHLADDIQEKLRLDSALYQGQDSVKEDALETKSLSGVYNNRKENYGTLQLLSKQMVPKKMTYTKSELELESTNHKE